MPKFTYISRRQAGVYYLQIRLPRAFGAGTKLWRCSLSTTKARQAQRAILPYLRWLLDMKDAKTVEQLIDSVLTQIDEFMRIGPAPSNWDMRLRLAVLYRIQDYLDEWTKADPCPIEYATLYRRLPELKEAQIHLGALVTADAEFYPEPLNEEDDNKLLKSYRSPLLYNHGREWVYEEAMANAKENGEDVEDAAYRCASNELYGSEAQDIAAHYFENVRRPANSDSAFAAPAASISGNSAAQWRDTSARTLSPTNLPVRAAAPGKRLSEAKESYLGFKNDDNGDRRADEDAGPVIDFLIDSVGDIPVNSLTVEMFSALDQALTKIPNLQGIPKESRHSLKTRHDYAAKHGWNGLRPMSVTRVKVWHVNLKQFFSWLREEKIYSGPAPVFKKLPKNFLRKAQSRAQFTNEELLRLFTLPLFTGCASKVNFWIEGNQFVQNQLYWAYVIMFFTGMRPSEICSLRTSDIKKDGNGKWIFDLDVDPDDKEIQRKTENAKRKIPVFSVLIDLGLIARKADLERAGTLRLFPEWGADYVKPSGQRKPGQYFTKSWQYLKTHHGFQRKGLTLYSLRHTRAAFYDLLRLPSRHRNLLLGHALTSVEEKYGGDELTDNELEELRNLPFNNVEQEIREILLAAKRKADNGELEVVKTWLNVRPNIKRKPRPANKPAPTPLG